MDAPFQTGTRQRNVRKLEYGKTPETSAMGEDPHNSTFGQDLLV